MKTILIVTAGHVDHGKTALIRSLTGINTDRLEEEQRRGMTIDLGFAPFNLADDIRADLIDVPGHAHYVKNMLAGAGAADLVLMVVAADEGVMPQTREHLAILSLLGARRGVVALTKCDLADSETRILAQTDAVEAFAGSFLERAPMLFVSTATGEGLDELRALLTREAQTIEVRCTDRPFFMPIDRVFTVKGFGTVVTGTVLDGRAVPGDLLTLQPSGEMARVRGVQSFGKTVDCVSAGQRAAVNLSGGQTKQLERGAVLSASVYCRAGTLLDVRLYTLPSQPRAIAHNARLHLSVGTACVVCRVSLPGGGAIRPGESAYARLRLETPVAARFGDRFVVRFYSPVETVGGGVILDSAPRFGKLNAAGLVRLQIREKGSLADCIADEMSRALLTKQDLCTLFWEQSDDQRQAACNELFAAKRILKLGSYMLSQTLYEARMYALTQTVKEWHAAHPLDDGMPLPKLRDAFSEELTGEAIRTGRLMRLGNAASLPGFSPYETPLYMELSARLLDVYEAAGCAPPEDAAALESAKIPADVWGRLLDLLCRRGALVRAAPALCFSQSAYMAARAIARAAGSAGITLAGLRDALGTSRKYAQALLEHFDAVGLTIRDGDAHIPREGL
ncbi:MULTISPECIES: selenocysteine-specific translation elongation factor [Anaerotruncus]|nr:MULTISPECIES: selenocysteine-specific translation elongation factor [Anaerotruncus]MCI8492635.1 selenocysteine-specific translation elongation factor [Anaerotruncus sp.]MCR2025120.1 selenocysteine-specific translation elongation factor [Anaerotruncus colihominis]